MNGAGVLKRHVRGQARDVSRTDSSAWRQAETKESNAVRPPRDRDRNGHVRCQAPDLAVGATA